jgi:hypothetical protein
MREGASGGGDGNLHVHQSCRRCRRRLMPPIPYLKFSRGNASLAIEYGLQSRSLPEPSLRSHRTSSLTVTTQLWRYPKCGWCCDPSR